MDKLRERGITTREQKQALAELLRIKAEDTKVSTTWGVATFITLAMPVWEIIIQNQMKQSGENVSFSMFSLDIVKVMFILIIILYYFRATIYINIFDFLNKKSSNYKGMYEIIQLDLVKDKSKRIFTGELSVKRKR